MNRMSLTGLKWLTMVLAVLFLVCVQAVAMGFVMPHLGRPIGHATSITAFGAGVVVYTMLVYRTIEGMQSRIVRQNQELATTNAIAVDISSLENPKEVLWTIADRSRELLDANAVAVSLFDQAGEGVTLAAWSGRPQAFRSPHTPGSWFPQSALKAHAKAYADRGNCCPMVDPARKRYSAPLCAGSEQIGELTVDVGESRTLKAEDLSLLGGLADLAAIAVQKANLMERDRQVAVLEERERLAREMHDSLAQVLGYLNLRSEMALRRLKTNDFRVVESELLEMSSIAREAYADVREAILGLRENVAPGRTFVETLREYLEKFRRQAGVAVQLELADEKALLLGPEAEVQLMRVIQEALTNVRKHARADEARISIGRRGGEAKIVVEDDGKGFDPALIQQTDESTFGLRTMRERVERAGGRFLVDSVPNKGTSVSIFLPMNGGRSHD